MAWLCFLAGLAAVGGALYYLKKSIDKEFPGKRQP
jgi:hypothetical protein